MAAAGFRRPQLGVAAASLARQFPSRAGVSLYRAGCCGRMKLPGCARPSADADSYSAAQQINHNLKKIRALQLALLRNEPGD